MYLENLLYSLAEAYTPSEPKVLGLLCAISNSKCVGATLYKEGGMTKERFVEFLEANIFNK